MDAGENGGPKPVACLKGTVGERRSEVKEEDRRSRSGGHERSRSPAVPVQHAIHTEPPRSCQGRVSRSSRSRKRRASSRLAPHISALGFRPPQTAGRSE